MGPILLKHIIEELNKELAGGVVSKIHQSNDRNVIFKIFVRGSQKRLIISAHPGSPRLHLTGEDLPNPPAPLRFCAYLRSRITNARIEGLSHVEGQRIANIALKKRGNGHEASFTLRAELTGKSGNIILLDEEGTVLDALRYFEPAASIRAVMPGVMLAPLPTPPPDMKEEFLTKPDEVSWNQAAESYYAPMRKSEAFIMERGRIRRAINEAEKKIKRKIENLRGDRIRAEGEIGLYRAGELLAANIGRLKRGMKEAEADDYTVHPPRKIRIALDERLGPKENAERYFKRAKKAKAALALLKDRIPEVEAELEFINALGYELTEAKTEEDIITLEEELLDAGYMKGQAPKGPSEGIKAESVRRFKSSDGFEILCGKSANGNDLIVKKYARDTDVWLHACKVPGSHVLIKTAGRAKDLTIKTIEEAAAIAALHSKARGETKAEVLYTEARNVKKPKGAKPGMVTVKEFKTVVVRPGQEGQ
ncbi:MAG: NFACT family protein [Deltaproteobacteria bacterium]|nr:NFACT family protein [Deltaproteobacteria bacterium]